MNIESLPRTRLARLDTPLEELNRLSAELGGPRLLMKRDDLIGLALGGNKVRKLEFLIGEALTRGADVLVTAGGAQSNHCRLTAAAAVKAGLGCHLVLAGKPPESANGNVLLDQLFGAYLHWCERAEREATLEAVAEQLRDRGRRPYVIPVGGSNEVGTVGYVRAMFELKQQLARDGIKADRVVVASSSGGTQAGLVLGAKLAGFAGEILGISIDQTKIGEDAFPPVLARIAAATAKRIDESCSFQDRDFVLNCDYLGAGYAIPGESEKEAIEITSRLEGILLGPVYTGRAMGGLIDLIRKGRIGKQETVVFWHTGGTPELFAYNRMFAAD